MNQGTPRKSRLSGLKILCEILKIDPRIHARLSFKAAIDQSGSQGQVGDDVMVSPALISMGKSRASSFDADRPGGSETGEDISLFDQIARTDSSYWMTEASTVRNSIPSVRAWASSKRSNGSL